MLDVVIVGAGVSGLCVAYRLQRSGFSYQVLEQSPDVGGTWRDNTYPDCACDVPAPLYSFSFAQRADWSRLFATQPEIYEYLRKFAARFRIEDHILYGARVVWARWQERRQVWLIATSSGARLRCRYLVSAVGALHTPRIPDISGRAHYGGNAFHSATWDHSVDLRGKHIAVIGNGASAVQFVPHIAVQAEHLTVFQRTPSWIVPKADRTFSPRQRLLRRLPPYRWCMRARLFWTHESRVRGFTEVATGMADTESLARAHLQRSIPDPQLRAALTPAYRIGCKRLLISNDYYLTLNRDNVTLVTAPVSKMTVDSVVTADGQTHPADVVIYGTGFDAQYSYAEIEVVGRGGGTLRARWQQGREAYLGTTVSGFPNYFLMLGPNSGLGHNSQIFMIEAQARYIANCLKTARRRGIGVLEVRRAVERQFNDWLRGRLALSVWQAGGCTSWYQHPSDGRNTALWPASSILFWRRTRQIRLSDYHTQFRTRNK